MAKRAKRVPSIEQHMMDASAKLRRAAHREGYKLSSAEADLLTAAGFAAMVRAFGEKADMSAAEVEQVASKFEASARFCAERIKREPTARVPFEAR